MFCSWTVANWISFISLLISIGTAILLIKNFFLGQKQTRISLSINQFNIYHKELEGFIEEGKEIKFVSTHKELLKTYDKDFEESNGIYYIGLFRIVNKINHYTGEPNERQIIIDDFRHQIIFPLFKYYDKILHFLNRINNDLVLSQGYKNILFNYIERDILQTYLRIANNSYENFLFYDLTVFETQAFKKSQFYDVNNFYISNQAFQFKDLDFYIKTN